MSGYDNSNQIILKKVHSDNPKAPKLRVEFELNGQKYKAGLWVWERKDGSPVADKQGAGQYIGKIEVDTYGQDQQDQGIAQAKQELAGNSGGAIDAFNDDIPF